MKKILLFLSFLLMSIGVWGGETIYIFTSKSWAANPDNWTNGKSGNECTSERGIQVTTGASGANGTSPKSFTNVSKVVITYSTNASKSAGSIAVKIGDNTASSQSVTKTGGTTDRILTYNFSPNQTGKVKVTVTCTTNSIYVKSITVKYSDSSPKYTVTYNLNGGTGTLPTETTKIEGETFTLHDGTTGIEPPSGKQFDMWKDQDNEEYDASSTYTMPSKNVTLTAQWKNASISYYQVKYHANGGVGTMTDANNPYMSGSTVTIMNNTFTRENNRFNGWNTANDGSGIDYNEGETFTITKTITLYAQWTLETETNGLSFVLVDNINDLNHGDSVIIVDASHTEAMSITQNKNNRGASTAFDLTDTIITLHDNSIQILKIHKIDDLWELYTGDGYLFAAGHRKGDNYLRTQVTNDNNGYWEITIDGTTFESSIVAQGSNSHNIMRYNSSSHLFACYTGGQQPLKIYKKINCDGEYIVTFKNNGLTHDIKYVPICAKRLLHLPSAPVNTLSCDNSSTFVGWSENEVTLSDTKPIGLFSTLTNAPIINEDKIFYAVFADVETLSARDENFTLTIDDKNFNGNSYADNNNMKTSIAESISTDDTLHIDWTSYQVYKNNGMQWQKNKGYIYNNSPLGTITSFEIETSDADGSYTAYFGSSVQPSSSTIVGNSYFKTEVGNLTGHTSKITIGFTKNITPKRYSNYTTYCIDTLLTEGNWNNSDNWKHSRVPKFNEAAVLLKPSTVNISHATAKYVIIDKSSSNTGKLSIQPNKGLEVQDTISVYDGTYNATTLNDLILESSSEGNASLIFNNNNNSQATVYLYSKATYPEGGTANWQYIGTTMSELSALYNYYGSWVYKWNNGWEVVHNGDMMEAWAEYCITQRATTTHETSGQLVPTDTEDKIITIKSPHTVFANSWTAPIHIGEFATEDFNVTDKTIYFFNTGLDSLGNGQVNYGDRTAPGTYVSVPINAATFLDKDSLIPSQQGVFVKTTTDGSITLRYKDLVRPKDGKAIVASPLRSPKRTMSDDKPNVLKIYAHGSIFGDRLTILEREDFSTGFDNGWDGSKMSLSDVAPSIYVVNEDGLFDEVSAIPNYEGTVLGFKNGLDNVCRLTFNYDGDDTWYLNDLFTLTSTLISNDNEYTFICDNTDGVRFIISAIPYLDVSTDIEHNSGNSNKPQKYFYNGNLYIIKNNRIFDVVGNLVK